MLCMVRVVTDDLIRNLFRNVAHNVQLKCPCLSRPEVTNYLLDEMKWETASGRQKTISIYQEAAHKWKKLATKLGLGEGEIDGIESEKRGKAIDCVRSVFGRWLENAQRMKHCDKYPQILGGVDGTAG